jgi:hypothetical protein
MVISCDSKMAGGDMATREEVITAMKANHYMNTLDLL